MSDEKKHVVKVPEELSLVFIANTLEDVKAILDEMKGNPRGKCAVLSGVTVLYKKDHWELIE